MTTHTEPKGDNSHELESKICNNFGGSFCSHLHTRHKHKGHNPKKVVVLFLVPGTHLLHHRHNHLEFQPLMLKLDQDLLQAEDSLQIYSLYRHRMFLLKKLNSFGHLN